MNLITYGFFGEDEAQRLFLHNYLLQLRHLLGKPEITFIPNNDFHSRFRVVNKQQVDALFAEAGLQGFLSYHLHLYFVGRDCDHHNQKDCTNLRKAMELKMDPRWRDRTLIFVPVQCIEHWLWYLKWHRENPGITKNVALENQSNADAKLAVYGRKKATVKQSQPIVEDLTRIIDINWLEGRSESFRAFHQKTVSSVTQLLA